MSEPTLFDAPVQAEWQELETPGAPLLRERIRWRPSGAEVDEFQGRVDQTVEVERWDARNEEWRPLVSNQGLWWFAAGLRAAGVQP